MDEGEFADLLLEQTQALLIDVAEIPRPLEGDEVEQRMEGYSDEIQGIALNLPPTADRHGHQLQARQRKRMSQGFGLPVSQQPNRSDLLAATRFMATACPTSCSFWSSCRANVSQCMPGEQLQPSAGAGVNALLQEPSSATADKQLMECVQQAGDLLTKVRWWPPHAQHGHGISHLSTNTICPLRIRCWRPALRRAWSLS